MTEASVGALFTTRSRGLTFACYPLRMEFRVEERDGDIIVTDGVFTAIYHKPDKLDPQLKLKRRTHMTTTPCLRKRGLRLSARRASWGGL